MLFPQILVSFRLYDLFLLVVMFVIHFVISFVSVFCICHMLHLCLKLAIYKPTVLHLLVLKSGVGLLMGKLGQAFLLVCLFQWRFKVGKHFRFDCSMDYFLPKKAINENKEL